MNSRLIAAALLAAVIAVPASAAAVPASANKDILSDLDMDVPARKFVLSNGLTLIVHEDSSAPLVAVNIWYHVGSKNEPKGRSGFAHLFEHLMFNGSENFNDDFFKATQKLGASDQNGTTSWDRTNYFQTVPKGALDSILWLESDRMGHLLGAIDQARLDEQRAVVKNEKREGDNRPYNKVDDLILRGTTPLDHPYGHSIIGSMDDLDAASLDDVRQWFREYYGAANAVIVLSGDIAAEEALTKVQKYFGSFAPGSPVSQPKSWTLQRSGTVREVAFDRISQPRIYRVWNVSDYVSPDTDYLQFLASILANDRNSRLVQRLVIDEQVATSVSAGIDNREIGGQFYITADLKPGADIAAVERSIEVELKKLLTAGPTAAEMARIRTQDVAHFVRSMESISGKAALLAESETYLGAPDAWKVGWSRYRQAKPADLVRAGKVWLTDGDYVLYVLPYGQLAPAGPDADRSKVPDPGQAVPVTFPNVERATLSNGMQLTVARRPGVPVVEMTLQVRTGIPSDFASVSPLGGPMAAKLLLEGTKSRTGKQLVDQLATLGANVSSGGGGEQSWVGLTTLKPTLGQAVSIFADIIQNPAYRPADVERSKAEALAGISAARADGASAAARIFPMLIFGKETAYGRIAGDKDVAAVEPRDLAAFHSRWFKPNNSSLVVAGDTSMGEIRPMIEAAFKGWQPGEVPDRIIPVSPIATASVIYLIDNPDAPQSVIRAAVIAPKRSAGDEIGRDLFNLALGGSFTSRLNMKLREEKGWAYGASSNVTGGLGSRVFVAQASVQADKTSQSMSEIAALISDGIGTKPIASDEIEAAKNKMGLGLASEWSQSSGVIKYLLDEAAAGLPVDYYRDYSRKIAATTAATVAVSGADLLGGKPLTWVVAGDLSKIEAPIRALKLGYVRVIDADGNVIR